MEHFKTIAALAAKYQTFLGYSALSLLAAVGETLFSSIAFRCPCNSWSHTYGLVFLLVPALLLFLLGFMLNMSLWKQVTGCCNTYAFVRGFRYWCVKKLLCLYIVLQVIFLSALPPLTWIALALLRVNFYECIVSGLPLDYIKERFCGSNDVCMKELLFIPCASSLKINLPQAELEQIQGNIRAESQVLGWCLIAVALLFAVVVACMSRCLSPVSHLQLIFWKTYIENEQKFFDEDSKQHAAQLAERNVKSFFNKETQAEFPTPTNNHWSRISMANSWNNRKTYYSPLHKFIERKNDSIKASTMSVLPPAEVNFAVMTV
ncbi:calcium homeostasis modulator protein 6-like [Bufo gargarizans]|uniref:calcium homeostasis modulator protein 6-like n=1 Tax=Bufo gargarizans TaxID=30331 RepID=UPI001CF2D516|nr:calcium homeostasis modulator protein 6-like [Bufo gargarizans]